MNPALIRKILPTSFRRFIRRHIAVPEYDLKGWREINPYSNIRHIDSNPSNSPIVIGIVEEFAHLHKHYMAACLEMGVPFRIVDISSSNWIDNVNRSECDVFAVWPSGTLSIWKEMFDDRLHIMVKELGLSIFPSLKEIWLYENKRRCRDWLLANKLPMPKTWVFYNIDEVREFAKNCELPIVFKTNFGASATGVRIVRSRKQIAQIVRQSFFKGFVAGRDPRDRQWGSVIFQEYLENTEEWRMIRIGNSFFGYKKERQGDYHSGSGKWSWQDPPRELLELLRKVTDFGNFTSMCVDIFRTPDHHLYINELQTMFGASKPADMLRIDGKPGRYVIDKKTNNWLFEIGDFSRNVCANARIDYLIHLEKSGH